MLNVLYLIICDNLQLKLLVNNKLIMNEYYVYRDFSFQFAIWIRTPKDYTIKLYYTFRYKLFIFKRTFKVRNIEEDKFNGRQNVNEFRLRKISFLRED